MTYDKIGIPSGTSSNLSIEININNQSDTKLML